MNNRKLRAIDLYSGIGGWSVGLEAAGIEVVRCYEWWDRALETYNQNLSPVAKGQNIRALKPEDINCGKIDVVVGSPPCTQFSYANRGGSGDLNDGLIDVAKFLEIVEYLQPKFWAMENVPRVAKILKNEIAPGGQLAQFAHLVDTIEVLDISDFGLPQRRKRMIAGRFPFDLLNSYKQVLPKRTLGDVLESLGNRPVSDPNYQLRVENVTEMENERPLDDEELRLNQDAKRYHPIYNRMSFPDELGRPARTVTALCTRVSRESIVIPDYSSPNEVRRLSIRERACLQGFPITYQFFGKSHSEKAKLIGNAVPPPLTYYLANAMLGIESHELIPTSKVIPPNREPLALSPATNPPVSGRKFPQTRRFRAALKGLRFGSGMRFELVNHMVSGLPQWRTAFYFGSSKDIKEITLDSEVLNRIKSYPLSDAFQSKCTEVFRALKDQLAGMSHHQLQDAWTHRINAPGPFVMADMLGDAGVSLAESLDDEDLFDVKNLILELAGYSSTEPALNGARKLVENSPLIIAGIIVCSFFNSKGVAILDRVKSAA